MLLFLVKCGFCNFGCKSLKFNFCAAVKMADTPYGQAAANTGTITKLNHTKSKILLM